MSGCANGGFSLESVSPCDEVPSPHLLPTTCQNQPLATEDRDGHSRLWTRYALVTWADGEVCSWATLEPAEQMEKCVAGLSLDLLNQWRSV